MRALLKLLSALLLIVFLTPAQASFADVNDFTFESFDAKYELSVNQSADNRPEMIVTETLVALFPETDQNRGIRRDIPASSYGSKPGLVQIISVTDESGTPREFSQSNEAGFVSLAIKAADDSFVYGRQTYVIRYKQSWVIENYQASSGFDEFYWDVNGTGWLQSFARVSATVKLDSKLESILVPEAASCYQGLAGSTTRCDQLQKTADGFFFSADNLQPAENLTVAIAFNPNIVNTRGPQVVGSVAWLAFVALGVMVILVLLWAVYFRVFKITNQTKKSFIVPQYLPANHPGLLASGIIAGKTATIIQASIVELAVTGQIEIEPLPEVAKTFILRRTATATHPNELLKVMGLHKSGDELLVGSKADSSRLEEMASSIQGLIAETKKRVDAEGYFLKRRLRLPALVFAVSAVIFGLWLFAGIWLDAESEAGFALAPVLTFGPFAAIYWLLVTKRALSSKGSEVTDYLKGLELYIKLAEAERLEFLQSPKGALLKPSQVSGKEVLKLYERVLPWAILLGLQKQWSKVLTDLYQKYGATELSAGNALLISSYTQLSSALSSSLAVSSSGGSSGGGSSGGGSGGGGGSGL